MHKGGLQATVPLSTSLGRPSPCAPLVPSSTWLHCSALLCSFLSPSFFKIAGCQLQPHRVFQQRCLKGACSGSRIWVPGDAKPVAMPPCPPRWCTVPQAHWANPSQRSGPGCPLLSRKRRGKQGVGFWKMGFGSHLSAGTLASQGWSSPPVC